MKRVWVRVVVSILSSALLFIVLFTAWLMLPSPLSNIADKLIHWPPSGTYTWIPHEQGVGPGLVWFFGPAILDIPAAALLFYLVFSL